MTYCRSCGTELDENTRFCPKCGTPVETQTIEKTDRAGPRRTMSPLTIAGIVLLALVVVGAVIAIPLLLGGIFSFSRVVGSGNVETQEFYLSDFAIVEAGSGFKVQITRATSYKIEITADDNLFEYIQVTKTGDTLSIRLRPAMSYQTTALTAKISMPDLQKLTFSGGTHGTATGFALSHDLDVELSGGSNVEMMGEANDLSAACSGGSGLELANFTVNNARIEFSGGSHGTINLDGRLDANLSGGSKLYYIGNPTMGDISTSGGSTISQK